jgi:hypothetical protein
MTAMSLDELRQAQRSGAAIRLAVRPPSGVRSIIADVVVTGVTNDAVTVSDQGGEQRTFALDTLVEVDAESQRRRQLRRVGWLFDLLGLTR